MPRPPRPAFAGATYHVTARGNNGEFIYSDDYDRYAYLALLTKAVRTMSVRVFAYVLMTNHMHLVLQTQAANISGTIHRLHGPYAYAYNRRHGRRGHLFERRFGSEVVEDDAYLLEVTRYIHLNPVRAGLAVAPEGYPWSSFRYYVDSGSEQTLVDVRPVLGLFGLDLLKSSAAYVRFTRNGVVPVSR